MSGNNRDWMRLAGIGPFFVAALFIGYCIGNRLLDKPFGTYPVWTVVFVIFGIAAGFINLIKEVILLNKAEKQERSEDADQHTGGDDPKP